MKIQPLYDDLDVWATVCPGNMWIFNKLQVAHYLGYSCGPAGIPVPKPAEYVVRPCVNLMGMGRGAEIKWLENQTGELVPAGYFWCERFTGRHISVDYTDREPVLAVEGIRQDGDPLWMWREWRKIEDAPPYPRICDQIAGYYPFMNVEFIGDKIIEIHFRHNPDWKDVPSDVVSLVPIYNDVDIDADFISNPEDMRLGFRLKRN
jgi:hypothetical protein